jgi:hypothetical protein
MRRFPAAFTPRVRRADGGGDARRWDVHGDSGVSFPATEAAPEFREGAEPRGGARLRPLVRAGARPTDVRLGARCSPLDVLRLWPYARAGVSSDPMDKRALESIVAERVEHPSTLGRLATAIGRNDLRHHDHREFEVLWRQRPGHWQCTVFTAPESDEALVQADVHEDGTVRVEAWEPCSVTVDREAELLVIHRFRTSGRSSARWPPPRGRRPSLSKARLLAPETFPGGHPAKGVERPVVAAAKPLTAPARARALVGDALPDREECQRRRWLRNRLSHTMPTSCRNGPPMASARSAAILLRTSYLSFCDG